MSWLRYVGCPVKSSKNLMEKHLEELLGKRLRWWLLASQKQAPAFQAVAASHTDSSLGALCFHWPETIKCIFEEPKTADWAIRAGAQDVFCIQNISKTKRKPSLFAPLAIASLAALAPDIVARTCQVLSEKLVQTLITARLDWRVKFFALHLQCFTKMPMLQQQVQAFAASSQGLLQTGDRRTNQIVLWQDSGQSSSEDEH